MVVWYKGLLILAIIMLPILPLYVTNAQQASKALSVMEPYSLYSTWYTDLSIQANMFASIPGRGIVAASGFDASSEGYFLEVLSMDSPSRTIYRSRYALSGIPTTIASDGDRGSYIAVGTDRGEAVVYNTWEGRASYIQASRFPVKRLSIGVGIFCNPILALLDSQGYLYLYRVTRGGWAEIGPRESTAVYSFMRSAILDISSTEVVYGAVRRVDPSLLLAIYTPPSLDVALVIYNETGYPISDAVVTASLAKPKATKGLVFQSISDQNGSAVLSLPLIDPSSTLYIVNITHPEYETESIAIELNQYMLEKTPIEYMVIMRSGQGEVTQIVKSAVPTYAVLLDATCAPESIRFGKPLLLDIKPVYAKLIKPNVAGVPWTYLGIIVGYREDLFVAAFIYFDQNLNPVPVKIQNRYEDYVWYILPTPSSSGVWVGYDNNGRGVSVILDSGRAYYFLYNDQRGFHVAFWGIDIPGSIVAADYRDGVLIAIDSSGKLHINRVDQSTSIECTRGDDYLGVPVGPGMWTSAGFGRGYLATPSRVYVINALQDIAFSRCSIELVRIYPRVFVTGVVSNYSIGVTDGYIEIYENDSLVARGLIINGSSILYLPRGSYIARVLSGAIEYVSSLVVSGSTIDLPGSILYRVRLFLYYYNPESPYAAMLAMVPPGLMLSIDGKINTTTVEDPLDLMLEGGEHYALLIGDGIELARARFTVSRSGDINIIFRVNTAMLNISVGVLGADVTKPPEESISIKLFAEGPLLRGDLGTIKPGSPVVLPLGIYRVIAASPFFHEGEALIGITEPGSINNLEVLLRPREIQVNLMIVDEFGVPVPNAGVSIINMISNIRIFSGITSSNGTITIPRIFFDRYLILIEPFNQSLYIGYRGVLNIDRQDLVVSINRTRYQVTIALIDPISGDLVSPVRVLVYMGDRLMYSEELSPGGATTTVLLPHGNARIVVEPAGQGSIYTATEKEVDIVVGGGRIEVSLNRRVMSYTISVIDDTGQPINGAGITIKSLENPAVEFTWKTGNDGKAEISIPYGSYRVTVVAAGYNTLEEPLPVGERNLVLKLQPTLLNMLSRFIMVYVAIGMVATVIVLMKIARRYMERRAEEEII
ncbi:MAG: carboxypeptidase-like regulatory domain-containing protein [Sulfolobales archaeon]